jgi:Kinesin motor domain
MKVGLRIRPYEGRSVHMKTTESSIEIFPSENQVVPLTADFVADCTISNAELQRLHLLDIPSKLRQGIDCGIVCYGNTSSGKTYTLFGESQETAGLTQLVMEEVFKDSPIKVHISFMQIYKDQVFDLLSKENDSIILHVKESVGGDFFIENLENITVKSLKEFQFYLDRGRSRRVTQSTKYNCVSSRSHAILRISIQSVNGMKADLLISDLAGNERMNEESEVEETGSINRSLFFLSEVITKLANKSSHVPFRDSKLTQILSPVLSGLSFTTMIINIHPGIEYLETTISSLRFAARAQQIDFKPRIFGSINESNLILAQKQIIQDLKREVSRLRQRAGSSDITTSRQEEGVFISNDPTLDKIIDSLNEKNRRTQLELDEIQRQLKSLIDNDDQENDDLNPFFKTIGRWKKSWFESQKLREENFMLRQRLKQKYFMFSLYLKLIWYIQPSQKSCLNTLTLFMNPPFMFRRETHIFF